MPCGAVDDLAAEIETLGADDSLTLFGVRRINMAVAAGPVIVGALGDGDRLEFTVIGSPMNLAAKLEKQNKQEGSRALASWETCETARRQGYEPRRDLVRTACLIEGVPDSVRDRGPPPLIGPTADPAGTGLPGGLRGFVEASGRACG